MGDSQPPGSKEFVSRVGTFFVLVGIGLLVFFILSEAAKAPTLSYFCWCTVWLTLGVIFRAQFKRPAGPASGRFTIFKRLKPKPKEEKKK